MSRITDRYVDKLIQGNIVDDIGVLKIRYAMSAFKSEAIKTVILIVIFYFLELLVPFLFTMILITPIRISTGGLHFNSNLSCFLISLAYFLLSVMVLPLLLFNTITYHLILGISAALIMILPLAPSHKRPIISVDKYLLNKYLSISFTLIYTFLLVFILDNQYIIKCGIWALALQAIQLLILKFKN